MRYVTSGLNNPGAPRRISTNVSTSTVPTTSRPVIISFRRNCILASFQNRAFSAAAQELSDHRVARPAELLWLGVFNDPALIQHSHSCADAKGAVHFMGHDDRRHLR